MGENDGWTPVSIYHREDISEPSLKKVNSLAIAEFDTSPGTHSLLRWHNIAHKLLEKAEKGLCTATVDFRGVYVAFTRACVILEEIIPEHTEFDNADKGFHTFKEKVSDKIWRILEYKHSQQQMHQCPFILAKVTEGKEILLLLLPVDLDYPTFVDEWHLARKRKRLPERPFSTTPPGTSTAGEAFRIWYDGFPQSSIVGGKQFIRTFEEYKRSHSLPPSSRLMHCFRRSFITPKVVPASIPSKKEPQKSITYWVLHSRMNPFEKVSTKPIKDERCLVRKLMAPTYRSVWLFARPLIYPVAEIQSSTEMPASMWFVFVTSLLEQDFTPVLTGKQPLWEGIEKISLGDVFQLEKDKKGGNELKLISPLLRKDIGKWEMISGELMGTTIMSTSQINAQANDILTDVSGPHFSESSLHFSINLIAAITGTHALPETSQNILSRLYTPQKIRPGTTYIPSIVPFSSTTSTTSVVHSTYFSVSTGYSTSYYTAEERNGEETLVVRDKRGSVRMSVNLEEARQRIRNAAGGVGVVDLEWIIP